MTVANGKSNTQGIIAGALAPFLPRLSAEERVDLLARVFTLIEQGARQERERCMRDCRDRAELWRTTEQARSGSESARNEARSRANEADYLADLFESENGSN
jgi:hypothetical protein